MYQQSFRASIADPCSESRRYGGAKLARRAGAARTSDRGKLVRDRPVRPERIRGKVLRQVPAEAASCLGPRNESRSRKEAGARADAQLSKSLRHQEQSSERNALACPDWRRRLLIFNGGTAPSLETRSQARFIPGHSWDCGEQHATARSPGPGIETKPTAGRRGKDEAKGAARRFSDRPIAPMAIPTRKHEANRGPSPQFNRTQHRRSTRSRPGHFSRREYIFQKSGRFLAHFSPGQSAARYQSGPIPRDGDGPGGGNLRGSGVARIR